ncbi:MAG: hypothetical protein ABIJ86_11435 [Spirochaetota bacterium]
MHLNRPLLLLALILASLLLSGSCSFWLERPPDSPDNPGPGARTLAEVYEALDSLAVRYPDRIKLETIGYGASAGFPGVENEGDIVGDMVGDPALPIRLAVWKDPDASR